jgi:hypothetical protein
VGRDDRRQFEGLRQEVDGKVRITSIEPGAMESDLKFNTSGTATDMVMDFCKQAIPASSIARTIAFGRAARRCGRERHRHTADPPIVLIRGKTPAARS